MVEIESQDRLLEVSGMKKYFPVRKGVFKRVVGHVKAVDDVDLFIREGETLLAWLVKAVVARPPPAELY